VGGRIAATPSQCLPDAHSDQTENSIEAYNTKAHLTVLQEAFTNNLNEWVYTKGIVDVVDKKGKDCIN